MNIIPIFTDFILCDYLNLDNKLIEDYCYREENKNNGVKKSNIGGWQSDDLFEKNIIDNLAFVDLFKIVENKFKELFVINGYDSFKYNLNIINFWININKNKSHNVSHNHPNSLFSAVYYVKCSKNSGNLVFQKKIDDSFDKVFPGIEKQYNQYNSKTWIVTPEEGKLIIFPSWLDHFVEPNRTTSDRISIAFNSDVK